MLNATELHERLAAIRILILDVDGVLTDGGIIMGAGEEYKRFDARDGTGIKYLRRHGVEVALVSGRHSLATERLAKELGIEEVCQRALRKWPVVEGLLERLDLPSSQAAYMGDDLVDLPVMRRVGVGIAVADAVDEVRTRADMVTIRAGGHGSVREVAEAIFKARGDWDSIIAAYTEIPEGGAAS